MIIQVLPFTSPVIGVLVSRVMANSREGISIPTSAMLVGGVPPPLVGTPRPSASTTPLSLSSQVVEPPDPSHAADPSSGVVTGIPSAPFASPPFMHTAQSGPSGSSSFVLGFPWNGGHIPPSTPYVGPTPAYMGMQFGNTNAFGQGFHTPVSTPFTSSPFSLFSGGIPAPVF